MLNFADQRAMDAYTATEFANRQAALLPDGPEHQWACRYTHGMTVAHGPDQPKTGVQNATDGSLEQVSRPPRCIDCGAPTTKAIGGVGYVCPKHFEAWWNAPSEPDPIRTALEHLIESLRPLRDSGPVAVALRRWADANGWRNVEVAGIAVALVEPLPLQEQLERLPDGEQPAVRKSWYDQLDSLSSAQLAAMTVSMLRNVSAGRDPTDYGMDAIGGITYDARRSYERRYRGLPGGPTYAWLERWQYGQAMHQLMLHGSSESASRRWIQRNPGLWPACTTPRDNFRMPWRHMRRRCRTFAEFQERHHADRDWPTPTE